MEELTDNAEEPDEAESKQSEVKLGKLQYKVHNTYYISAHYLYISTCISAYIWPFYNLIYLSEKTIPAYKDDFNIIYVYMILHK